MTYDVRKAIDADWDDIAAVMFDAFNDEFDEESSEAERVVFEPDRTVVATLDGSIAGVAGAYTRTLTVPGGIIPAAHVTMVSVGATHRRQGLLNRMITNLHETASALGESVAVLWASEGRIYQRYGYGLASRVLAIDGRTTEFALTRPVRRRAAVGAGDDVRECVRARSTTSPGRPGSVGPSATIAGGATSSSTARAAVAAAPRCARPSTMDRMVSTASCCGESRATGTTPARTEPSSCANSSRTPRRPTEP